MSYIGPGMTPTNHIQVGPMVYVKELDKIVDMRTAEINFWEMEEVVGSYQGDGLETSWWDGTNKEFVFSDDPKALQQLSHEADEKIAKMPSAQPVEMEETVTKQKPQRVRVIYKKSTRKQ